jgi:hypothetical protein
MNMVERMQELRNTLIYLTKKNEGDIARLQNDFGG